MASGDQETKTLLGSVGDEDPKIVLRRRVSSAKRRPLTRSGHCWVETSYVPTEEVRFDDLWALKPAQRCRVMMQEGPTEVHRWQLTLGQVPAYEEERPFSYMFGVPGEDEIGGPIREPWASLLQQIAQVTGSAGNQVTVNWYDASSDFIAFHADYHQGLEGPVSILSLYADARETRELLIKAKRECKNALQSQFHIPMSQGSVVSMGGDTQQNFLHSVRKSPQGGRRISVTVRNYRTQTSS